MVSIAILCILYLVAQVKPKILDAEIFHRLEKGYKINSLASNLEHARQLSLTTILEQNRETLLPLKTFKATLKTLCA